MNGRQNNRMFLLRVLTAALGALGLVMLLSGILLRQLDAAQRHGGRETPMPEEYIEEFFPEESQPDILAEIEPEAAEE